ncbi:aspartyl-tRNA(Asn)/glutamyl-tRNA(Gln) amidotransferase subunit A [Paracoccus isoporae]|uniref:Aspartyl-tRNA(Asn)/glutamyl-tRNA(Gln) amidotransferase subunit A n=1 Tax=Paracoccus isoporae TaxID=591205 RepID=A0A1G6ZE18_9RHOB|nr:amidase [Paracoccus isoporae]SDE00543.1 aspartyl-tRNA(Asn)/glutamyl-tRNA(Gln) amidotransferase subunit A [Paracoccus isoporae]
MNPADLPLSELAPMLRAGDLTARELIEAHLSRIEARDGLIRAFVHLDADGARRAADQADRARASGATTGPLHGIPFAVKDLLEMVGGENRCGSRQQAARGTQDAAVIARLRRAGAIPLGRVATYEFALTGPGGDTAYPPARNPWHPDRITGGSSSGSAAAVAAGMVRIAIGTDTGGSVRSPAAYCGIVGLKPSRDLLPMAGVHPLSPSLDHLGPLAASVGDAALMLDAMAGRAVAMPGIGRDIAGLRIAYARDWFADDPDADPALIQAMDDAASTLSMLGARISLTPMPDYALAESAAALILHDESFRHHRAMLRATPERYGRQARQALAGGIGITPDAVARARRAGQRITARMDALLYGCDAIIAPTTLAAAPPVSAFAGEETVWTAMRTIPFNLTGHPALSLPVGFSSGLPLGMQIIAAHGAEAMICRIGAAFEAATDVSAQSPAF